ncbi:hypothetical protein BGZ83_006432 [Gryganskiella cystojenkinii]|nr:hypothetical protein BGZ83_006432 [Gryganskiella cystojenkinii]
MVQLSLPLLDNTDNESGNSSDPNCDPSQSIYNKKSCIKDFLFCSDDNPCPSKIPCIDRVCQCLPNTKQYITLTPPPVRMYTIGCHFDTQRPAQDSCRDYEYGVSGTCLLNYCSSEVPCYAGQCDNKLSVCVNITSSRQTLPTSSNPLISLGDDPFGTHKEGISPFLIVIMACAGVVALAVVGCIIRTTLFWTKSSVAWVAGGHKKSADDEKEDYDGGIETAAAASKGKPRSARHRDMLEGDEISVDGGDRPGRINRVPSKFTGSHYLPTPPVMFSNEISPFSSPLPSPRFSPYSQPNQSQVSNNSLMNPFRYGANSNDATLTDGASARSIEMNDRAPSTASTSTSDEPHIPPSNPAVNNNSTQRLHSTPQGPDLRIARSHTVSHDFSVPPPSAGAPSTGTPMARRIEGGPGGPLPRHSLQKSSSMLQLGSRPAPPPPSSAGLALQQSRSNLRSPPLFPVSAPLPTLSAPLGDQSTRSSMVITSANLQGPSPSLDSIMQFSSNSNNNGGQATTGGLDQDSNTVTGSSSAPGSVPSSPSLHSLTSAGGGPSMLVLQSAERHAAVTVPPRSSMLKHSASVPMMVVPQQAQALGPPGSAPSPGPASRNLPAGFASSPVANYEERFQS